MLLPVLFFGEVGVTLSGTGTQGNKGDRLFVGDNSGNPQVVGGRYFTDLISHAAGSINGVLLNNRCKWFCCHC